MATPLTVHRFMSSHNSVLLGGRLTVDDVEAIARRRAVPELADRARDAMARCYAFVQRLASSDAAVYGLTTGCGPLAESRIPPADRTPFQRNLVRSHAVTLGPAHPIPFVRAAMATRAHVLALGCSGVAPETAELLIGMLARTSG